MARAAIREHHRRVPVNTARVTAEPTPSGSTSPVTGFAYLDSVLDQPGSVIAMAHRGGALHPEIPGAENTLHAFRHAAALGYHYLETDVHATSDGVLLAFHDPALDRVTDTQGRPGAADLRRGAGRADRRRARRADDGRAARGAARTAGSTSTSSRPRRCEPLADLLDRTGSHDRVCVGSFSQRRLDAFRRASRGRVATSASAGGGRAVPRAALGAGRPARSPADGSRRCRCRTDAGGSRSSRLRSYAAPTRAGAHVHVWTVDEPAEMDELLDLGVDGLITDRTDVLKQVLMRRGQWRDHS